MSPYSPYIIGNHQSSLSSNHIAAAVYIGATACAGSYQRIINFEKFERNHPSIKKALFIRNYGIQPKVFPKLF